MRISDWSSAVCSSDLALGDTFTISDHALKLGDPVSYAPRGNTPALPRAAYYFAIPVDGDRFKLWDSQYLAGLGVSVSVGSWVGTHWIVRCAIADNIDRKSTRLNSSH